MKNESPLNQEGTSFFVKHSIFNPPINPFFDGDIF